MDGGLLFDDEWCEDRRKLICALRDGDCTGVGTRCDDFGLAVEWPFLLMGSWKRLCDPRIGPSKVAMKVFRRESGLESVPTPPLNTYFGWNRPLLPYYQIICECISKVPCLHMIVLRLQFTMEYVFHEFCDFLLAVYMMWLQSEGSCNQLPPLDDVLLNQHRVPLF